MNYITQINAFRDIVAIRNLSAGQIALWYALMDINNKCAWIDWFTVAQKTLEINTGLSLSGIKKARTELKNQGLIDYKPRGQQATAYNITNLEMPTGGRATGAEKQFSSQDGSQDSSHTSSQDSSHNSSQDGSQDGSALYKQNKTKRNKTKLIKEKSYGEFGNVLLSEEELKLLKDKYSDYEERIERLSAYIKSKGTSYKNHYATIVSWANKEKTADTKASGQPKPKTTAFNNYEQRVTNYDSLEDDYFEEIRELIKKKSI